MFLLLIGITLCFFLSVFFILKPSILCNYVICWLKLVIKYWGHFEMSTPLYYVHLQMSQNIKYKFTPVTTTNSNITTTYRLFIVSKQHTMILSRMYDVMLHEEAPLKWGHPCNQDIYISPKVPLYSTIQN